MTVSFSPRVQVIEIPPVDAENKHLLYYNKCELFLFQLERKRSVLLQKMLHGLADLKKTNQSIVRGQKRPTDINLYEQDYETIFEEDNCYPPPPTKRARLFEPNLAVQCS
mmetsp:Transcript_30090/g.42653  ORF Transcript_30090/g.42653 Transcript_30090/m.42653 type:complete len:110 (+) Transcript_30090:88-417(+)|eukprot:CAMPEP_0202456220 /NCGR_PEP_ID=MMETSP1360-20130828/13534_1 /ASSEMBLY_ACC=CAM_ASM_000848 /TAXON_ID=515479 /ORGANISM="Licmophora paradoxa, Strain CCMP2313" /LENGTH=109 /DNA_ID=CAMNT_0049075967 /DNA_START=89 /DNA_END=418 /DNA_ORIENTATION=-